MPATDPFAIRVAAAEVQFEGDLLAFDLEIGITNLQAGAVEGLRPSLALISARADQDRWSAAFHAGPLRPDAGVPIDLEAGADTVLPVRLRLRRDQVQVVQLGVRPMMVAMLLVDLRWRAGLSIRRFGGDFLLGSAGQGTKPGPIWLDRPPPAALAATRYVPAASA